MRRNTLASLVALAMASSACGDALGPAGSGAMFSQAIGLESLEGIVTEGTTRVEIKLVPGTLVAREIEIKEPEEVADREKIESPVTAVDRGVGAITLAIGDLAVTFDATTSFRAEDGEELSSAAFLDRLEAALADGRQPAIEARRPAPATPQAPEDASFLASRIELDDEADEPEIEINVDADNFVRNDTPPPDAWLRVLGQEIEIRSGDGTTELEEETDRDEAEVEFEGVVASVDEGAATVTLSDGTVLLLVSESDVEHDGDDDNLSSLSEVAAALEADAVVEAEGEGLVESTDPLTLLVVEVEFEVEDDADDVPGTVDFEGRVAAIDEAEGTVTLANGTVILVDGDTRLDDSGDDDNLASLAAAAEALAAGEVIEADGEGVIESFEPRVIRALELELEIED